MAAGCEKVKRKKTTRATELPEEVIRQEILTRLPVKSVTRFKSVCKLWLSVVSDPRFVKEHLTRNTSQNPNDDNCLVAQKANKKFNKIVILSRYRETIALRTPQHRVFDLVGSTRGLVCLYYHKKFTLWNPAIHQSKEFTLPPSRCDDRISTMGFGYDHASDIYKVVVISHKLRSASVYCSNVDSWIDDVYVPDNVHVYLLRNKGCMTVVKNCPHWAFSRYTKEKEYLTTVKFDTETDEFKLLPELHICTERYRPFKNELVDMNDCLALIVPLQDSGNRMVGFDIYTLDGEEGCCVWSKMYRTGPLGYESVPVAQGFYGGEIVFEEDGTFSCYDHETNRILCLTSTSMPRLSRAVSCFRYAPSLVLLEGMEYVYLPTQTRRTSSRCCPQRLINSLKKAIIM